MKAKPARNRLLPILVFGGTIILGGLFLTPQATYATVADGVYAYEKGDYQRAREEWLPYAALGNPNALYNLGQLSRMGRGVEQNFQKAEEYYLRAAEKGHVGAQRNLGTLYYFGRIAKADHARAFDWLIKAATSGDNRAQLMVGTMYFNGEAVEKNNVRAYAWIKLASQSGLKSASNTLDKLTSAMTSDQITQARELAPALLSRLLTPDDVGLMVNHRDSDNPATPELNSPPENPPEKPNNITETVQEAPEAGAASQAGTGMVADNYRVQLASFRTEETAEKSLKRLESRLGHLLTDKQGHIEFADLGEKGIYYRLQLSPFGNRPDAMAFCDLLKENNRNCYVVKTP